QNKVLPLHVASVAHLVEEGSGERMSWIGPRHHGDRRSRQNQPYSVSLASLLRLNRQWHKTEAKSQNDREPDPPHGHLGGRLAGVEPKAGRQPTAPAQGDRGRARKCE